MVQPQPHFTACIALRATQYTYICVGPLGKDGWLSRAAARLDRHCCAPRVYVICARLSNRAHAYVPSLQRIAQPKGGSRAPRVRKAAASGGALQL